MLFFLEQEMSFMVKLHGIGIIFPFSSEIGHVLFVTHHSILHFYLKSTFITILGGKESKCPTSKSRLRSLGLRNTISGAQKVGVDVMTIEQSTKEQVSSGKRIAIMLCRQHSSIAFWIFSGNKEQPRNGMCQSGSRMEEMDIGFLSTQDIRSLLSPICVFTLLYLFAMLQIVLHYDAIFDRDKMPKNANVKVSTEICSICFRKEGGVKGCLKLFQKFI